LNSASSAQRLVVNCVLWRGREHMKGEGGQEDGSIRSERSCIKTNWIISKEGSPKRSSPQCPLTYLVCLPLKSQNLNIFAQNCREQFKFYCKFSVLAFGNLTLPNLLLNLTLLNLSLNLTLLNLSLNLTLLNLSLNLTLFNLTLLNLNLTKTNIS